MSDFSEASAVEAMTSRDVVLVRLAFGGLALFWTVVLTAAWWLL